MAALPADAQEAAKEPAYRAFPLLGSRLAVWAIAQLHLNFAAFILGVPIFAVIIEIIGWRTAQERYDWLSHQFVKLTFAAFRSEEHTSELQSQSNLVCRLLLEKKKTIFYVYVQAL